MAAVTWTRMAVDEAWKDCIWVLRPDQFPAGRGIAESGRLYIFLNLVSFQKFSGGFEK